MSTDIQVTLFWECRVCFIRYNGRQDHMVLCRIIVYFTHLCLQVSLLPLIKTGSLLLRFFFFFHFCTGLAATEIWKGKDRRLTLTGSLLTTCNVSHCSLMMQTATHFQNMIR